MQRGLHPASPSLPGTFPCLRLGGAERRWDASREGAGVNSQRWTHRKTFYLDIEYRVASVVLEGVVCTFFSCSGPRVTRGPGRHVTGTVRRRAAAARGPVLGPGRGWREPRPVWGQLTGGRLLRPHSAAIGGGGVLAALAMATVREKAARLNLPALHSPAERPPGKC